MSKNELKSLQELAKSHGGSLTTNPDTGLPEAGFLSSLLPMVIGGALVASGVGAPLAAGLVGGGYGLATGSLSKGLMAGLGAYSGGSLAGGLTNIGTGELSKAAGAGLTDEAASQAVAQKLAATSPMDTFSTGVKQLVTSPSDAFKSLGGGSTMKGVGMLAGAAAPALAGSMLQQKPGDEYKPGGPNPYEYSYDHTTGQYTRQAPGYRDGLNSNPGVPRAMADGGYAYSYDPYTQGFKQTSGPSAANLDGGGMASGLLGLLSARGDNEYKYSYDPTTQTYNQLSAPTATPGVGGPAPFFDGGGDGGDGGGGGGVNGSAGTASTGDTGANGDTASAARGGIMAALAGGGQSDLGDYSDGGRMLRGPGDGVSDSIPATIGGKQPARLADGEFVVPARIVSEIGNGSTEAGARKLYAMMDRVQGARKKSIGKGKVAVNSRAEKLLPA
jgi:hypothetical protein